MILANIHAHREKKIVLTVGFQTVKHMYKHDGFAYRQKTTEWQNIVAMTSN